MSCLPFPSFVDQIPVDASNKRAALSASGSCRIAPLTCAPEFEKDFEDIFNKNKEQALVDSMEGDISKDEKKKLKKKYMKQGVAMATTYLTKSLQLDVSVVNVQIVLDAKMIVETDGCLSACFLDAGCTAIVIDGKNLEAMDAAKIPKERIVASFPGVDNTSQEDVTSALQL